MLSAPVFLPPVPQPVLVRRRLFVLAAVTVAAMAASIAPASARPAGGAAAEGVFVRRLPQVKSAPEYEAAGMRVAVMTPRAIVETGSDIPPRR